MSQHCTILKRQGQQHGWVMNMGMVGHHDLDGSAHEVTTYAGLTNFRNSERTSDRAKMTEANLSLIRLSRRGAREKYRRTYLIPTSSRLHEGHIRKSRKFNKPQQEAISRFLYVGTIQTKFKPPSSFSFHKNPGQF